MDIESGSDQGPNPIDLHVGCRIRLRRKALGLTQERLAESLGLTFQQVQKYERAANRVSASKLWEVAQALSTSVAFFYEGLGPNDPPEAAFAAASPAELMLSADGVEFARLLGRIERPTVRRQILELVRTLGD
jgi:transcriptional regulator with XRE-family HTH domain